MSLRALLLGIILGLLIPVLQPLNAYLVRQQIYLIGNQLPLGVFGVVILILLVWNPLVRKIREAWVLRASEIAIIAALGLAVCAWPGSNFMRLFPTGLAMPAHLLKSKINWQTSHVMSYLPGGSPLLAEGFIRDWNGLVDALSSGGEASADSPPKRIWAKLSPDARQLLRGRKSIGTGEKKALLAALNKVIGDPDLYSEDSFSQVPVTAEKLLEKRRTQPLSEREVELLNRDLLDTAFAGILLPRPKGEGILLADGRPDPQAVDTLIQGAGRPMGIEALPWRTWWPSLKLWGGLALLLAIASLCMALIVHPQWSKRELLPYPIARFMEEITETREEGQGLVIFSSKLFWIGLGGMMVVHLTNGLNAWFPGFVSIPLQFDFTALQQLFPNASKIEGAHAIFRPTIFPAVVAFSFFLRTDVSFSLGILGFVWLGIAGFLIGNGIPVSSEGFTPGKFSLLTFGGFIAFTAMLLFVGRRYYLNVAGGIFGLRRHEETPVYSIWAGRGMFLSACLGLYVLTCAGLDPLLAGVLICLILMIFFVMSRIYAETGAMMVQCGWAPTGMLMALMGLEALGPTSVIVMSIACLMVISDSRETWMAYFVNGLQMSSSTGQTPPRRMVAPLLGMLMLGMVVTIAFGFLVLYNKGLDSGDRWSVDWAPGGPFNSGASVITELSANDELEEATAVTGLDRLSFLQPMRGTWLWVLGGGLLVAGCYVARLRLSWWPIHPVLFLVWGTWAAYTVAISFFLGWLFKFGVMKSAGARAYHTLKPLMVGIIAGELLAAILWGTVGVIYYINTELAPTSPRIFP